MKTSKPLFWRALLIVLLVAIPPGCGAGGGKAQFDTADILALFFAGDPSPLRDIDPPGEERVWPDDQSFEIVTFRSVARYAFDLLSNAAKPGSEVGLFAPN